MTIETSTKGLTDGTLIFTDVATEFLNTVLDERWLHVLIFLRGSYYEATWPRVRKIDRYHYRRRLIVRGTYTEAQVDKMVEFAESKLGLRYNFWGYFFPRWYNKTHGVYCSQYACQVLRAGDVPIPIGAGYSPDKLLKASVVYNL